jgi:thiamine pyrophosphate-dependent acetolactate synthase large subunit-like protein
MKALAICVIGAPTPLQHDVSLVVDKLLTGARPAGPPDGPGGGPCLPTGDSHQVLARLLDQAQRYLAQRGGAGELHVLSFESPDAFRTATLDSAHPLRSGELSLEMFFVDVSALDRRDDEPGWASALKAQLVEACASQGLRARFSPHSFTFYLRDGETVGRFLHAHGAVHPRLLTTDHAARRADIVRILLDHLDHAHFNRMLARAIDAAPRPVAMASAVTAFFRSQWGEQWDCHSFTGSVIAAFIDSMAALADGSAVRSLTGVNEHALACGALAGWQLFGRAYVIAITSGMVDEFKGTLSNLCRARAPGLIVCADSVGSQWHAFQGTINQDGDGRAVMRARGVPHVYIENVDDMAAGLQQAFDALRERGGPVVVFATPAVLESSAALALPAATAAVPRVETVRDDAASGLDEALRIVNQKDGHLLWQCGRLSDRERTLVYEISRRAGIALADSLAHPGSVSGYRSGEAVDTYLGTLGLYAFSRRVHRFLHAGDELHPKDRQSLFFLKSKVDQMSTPFSEGKLSRNLHVVQVNRDARDFAPFADVTVQMSTQQFLERMVVHLDVKPHIVEKRHARIAALRALPPTMPVDWIETVPMTANYFFHRLATLVETLIEREGYRYTGVFDVGRCGVSAIRNMPRTGPGFSGWYGRALMGDALMAMPYVALNAPGHVLAFIGDGARGVVPDVEEQLAALLAASPTASRRNVSVFYLANGALSMIQSYLDFRFARHGGAQVSVPTRTPREGTERCGRVRVHRRVIERFDEASLGEALTDPGRLNFFEVGLAHNSSGDGMSLASETTWSRATPVEGSLS